MGPDGLFDAEVKQLRDQLAAKYLTGQGIEIGALNFPIAIPPGAQVTYVDYLPADKLRADHLQLAEEGFVEPDVVDDGEKLATFADGSVDFVVANHFIEHAEDPVATIATHLRVLRPNGVLFLTVPDKRLTFDRERATTSVEHLRRDHREGPEGSRAEHYREWARSVDMEDPPPEGVEKMATGFSIHFHTWTPTSFVEFLAYARREEGLEFEIERVEVSRAEFIVILRKPMELRLDPLETAAELSALRREHAWLDMRLSSITGTRRHRLGQRLDAIQAPLRRLSQRLKHLIRRA